jgi:hypothetical protein
MGGDHSSLRQEQQTTFGGFGQMCCMERGNLEEVTKSTHRVSNTRSSRLYIRKDSAEMGNQRLELRRFVIEDQCSCCAERGHEGIKNDHTTAVHQNEPLRHRLLLRSSHSPSPCNDIYEPVNHLKPNVKEHRKHSAALSSCANEQVTGWTEKDAAILNEALKMASRENGVKLPSFSDVQVWEQK